MVVTCLGSLLCCFGNIWRVRTDSEGTEFCKVNYFPAASSDLYICDIISASHVGTRANYFLLVFTRSLVELFQVSVGSTHSIVE